MNNDHAPALTTDEEKVHGLAVHERAATILRTALAVRGETHGPMYELEFCAPGYGAWTTLSDGVSVGLMLLEGCDLDAATPELCWSVEATVRDGEFSTLIVREEEIADTINDELQELREIRDAEPVSDDERSYGPRRSPQA
jgi:hypothetical protein